MSWLDTLQNRWKMKSIWQVIVILIVFACTGFTVLWLKRPALHFFFGDEIPSWAKALYYILILPIYNVILLFYGFVFGQFHFFLEFEKRMFKKIVSFFSKGEG
ncbi:MAG TPA: hypothetical protein DGG95_09605 [Cytophagales bacterium]|jgi:hypothetical protein|nr:hypothetical protein [Cytophagales bacterium]